VWCVAGPNDVINGWAFILTMTPHDSAFKLHMAYPRGRHLLILSFGARPDREAVKGECCAATPHAQKITVSKNVMAC
jgi:hypothetical protein